MEAQLVLVLKQELGQELDRLVVEKNQCRHQMSKLREIQSLSSRQDRFQIHAMLRELRTVYCGQTIQWIQEQDRCMENQLANQLNAMRLQSVDEVVPALQSLERSYDALDTYHQSTKWWLNHLTKTKTKEEMDAISDDIHEDLALHLLSTD